MGIEVIDLISVDTRIAHRTDHGSARTIHIGSGHVPCVSAHAKATDFSVNLGTARLGVFVLFQHHDTSAFAEHKTVTVFVPGARGRLRVIIAR